MKKRLLDLLICPVAKTPFELVSFDQTAGEEVIEGMLFNPDSKHSYPIVNGVPVILPNANSLYPEFFQKHASKIGNWQVDRSELAQFKKEKLKTQESFGFEWTHYNRMIPDRDEGYVLEGGLTRDFFKGKLILDAGCGYGRHTRVVHDFGSEIVGIDLSKAIMPARNLLKEYPRAHLVQADIFNLPFRLETFDVVYSWGVLHHTPNPRKAFESLVPLVKENGHISVKIYRKSIATAHFIEGLIRKITLRIPLKALYYLSYLGLPLNSIYWLGGRHIPGLSHLIRLLIKTDPDWRISHIDTFDWYHPEFQFHYKMEDIIEWYKEAGLKEIVSVPSKGVRGKRPPVKEQILKTG